MHSPLITRALLRSSRPNIDGILSLNALEGGVIVPLSCLHCYLLLIYLTPTTKVHHHHHHGLYSIYYFANN